MILDRKRFCKRTFFIWILLIAANRTAAEQPQGMFKQWCIERCDIITSDVRSSRGNLQQFVHIPFRADASKYLIAGSLLGLNALSFIADQSIRHKSEENHTPILDKIVLPWEKYGNSHFPIGIATSLYIGGLVFSKDWLRETGRECLMSLFCAGLVSSGLKVAVGRERPYTNETAFDLDPFSLRPENTSFPSGHTTVAFAFSTVLAARIGNPFVATALYGAACMTAAQRIYSDNHWLSDVMLGAIIGTTSGLFIVHDSDRLSTVAKHSFPRLTPFVTARGAGIAICKNF